MLRRHVMHLVDDATAGGVMRVLDHITTAPEMTAFARQTVMQVRRGRPYVRRIDADVIVSHLSVSWRTLPALIALRALHPHRPLIHVEHSYTEAFAAQNVTAPTRFLALLRTAYALFDQVVAVSTPQAGWLLDQGLVESQRLSVIKSCVSLDAFAALPAPPSRARILGAIGRLDRQKGFDVLIKAFRITQGPDLRLRIVGDGQERAALEALAVGDTRIEFTGAMTDPVAAMNSVDAVFMPSRWEAFGLVALEARAARRPVVVARVDGLLDHAGPGVVMVDDLSPLAWSKAISELVGKDRGPDMDASGKSGLATAAQSDLAEGWRKLIREACSASSIPNALALVQGQRVHG